MNIKAGDRIVYPATAYHGHIYPDFAGVVLSVTPTGYLKVRFDKIHPNDIRTITAADLAA